MTPSPTLITLFTDAGHCVQTRISVYAIWAKCSGRTIRHSGVLETAVATSGEAEFRALANGIFVAIRLLQPAAGSKIIAQTDAQEVIGIWNGGGRNKTRTRHQAVTDYVRNLLASSGVALDLRHVAGHRGNRDPRSAVNNWCDRECRRLLRAERASLETKPKE